MYRLEYKYMKLVGATEGKDGEMELPTAETCALSEDEEEQFDAVDFKEAKGNKFFSKIKNMGKKVGIYNFSIDLLFYGIFLSQ